MMDGDWDWDCMEIPRTDPSMITETMRDADMHALHENQLDSQGWEPRRYSNANEEGQNVVN